MRHKRTKHKPKWSKIVYFSYFLLLASYFVSCEHPDLTVPQPNENLRAAGDFIRNNYQFRLLYEALDYTGLYEELNGDGPFTVFAMSDEVFNSIGIYNRADIEACDRDSLRQALAYNVLPVDLPTSDFPTNGIDRRYMTLSGKEIYASSRIYNEMFWWYIDGVSTGRTDVTLANGTLHVLSRPIKYYPDQNLTEWLSEQEEHHVFVEGLKKFGLWEELSEEGPFTIFAPTNAALLSIGITSEWLSEINPDDYRAERLFGAYILYDRHYFLSDYFVIGASITDNRVIIPIKNDTYSIAWSAQYNMNFSSYDLFLMPPNATNISESVAYTGSSTDITVMDRRFENGVVHQLQGGLVRPELALRN